MSKSDPSNPEFARDRRPSEAIARPSHPLVDEVEGLQARLRDVEHLLEHQSRLATIGTIAGLIAHEFNNILTPVLTYSQMALAKPDDTALARRALERAAEGSERAAKIAAAILGFVREQPIVQPSDGVAGDGATRSTVNRDSSNTEAGERKRSNATPSHVHRTAKPMPDCSTRNIESLEDLGESGGVENEIGSALRGIGSAAADIRASLEHALTCLGRDVEKDGIQLNVLVEEQAAARIEQISLEHIMLNLILNARNAMLPTTRGRGRLNVRALVCSRRPSLPSGAVSSNSVPRGTSGSVFDPIKNQTKKRDAWALGGESEGSTSGHSSDTPGTPSLGGSGGIVESHENAASASSNGWLVLEIEDTGRGMSAEQLAKLFTAFKTGGRANEKKGYTGTGLGMTVCRRLVERAGGEMQAWSTRGKGTCVRVVLPAA